MPHEDNATRDSHSINKVDIGTADNQLGQPADQANQAPRDSSLHNDGEPQQHGVLSKIERHPYISGAMLGLAVLAARFAILAHKAEDTISVNGPAKITRTVVTDLNGDGQLEPGERLNMGPVLSEPIGLEEGQIPEDLKRYKPKFVAAYHSLEGEAFNFYATAQPGEESALDQDFELNPQSIEYILTQISSHIQDAPENSSKKRIMDNLRAIKNGDKESITNIVIDVSPTAGCMNPSYQLVKFTDAICASQGIKGGFAGFATESQEPGQQSIVIAAGNRYVDVKSNSKATFRVLRDVPGQEETTGHEMIHDLGEEDSNDTYKEGDPDHEITSWLIDGYHYDKFDFEGATGPSPFIGNKIEQLVASGVLPPILSVKK